MLRASTPWGVLHRSSEHRAVGSSGTACAALLAIEERGHLSRDLRTSTEAAGLSRVPGMGAVQRAPGARGAFTRVHLQRALILSLVKDGRQAGDQAAPAPPSAATSHQTGACQHRYDRCGEEARAHAVR